VHEGHEEVLPSWEQRVVKERADNRVSGGRRGFTLIELLVVIAIIGILAGLLLGGINAVRDAARRKKAATQVQTLIHAIKAYRIDYDAWPGQQGTAVDTSYTNLKDIMGALTNNARQITYLETYSFVLTNRNSEYQCLDPWQRPYVVTMDDSGDDITSLNLTTPLNLSTDIHDTVAIMSWGQNPDNEVKRVYSWK